MSTHLSLLVLAFMGCGGQSVSSLPAETGEATGPADAVLWIAPASGPVELRGVRLGAKTAFDFGSAWGNYVWSPDRRRMFLEGENDERVIVGEEGKRRRVSSLNGYSHAWSPDGSRWAAVESDRMTIADADGMEPFEILVGDVGTTPWVDWSPDGTKIAFKLFTSVVIVDASTYEAVAVPASSDAFVHWAPTSAFFAVLGSDTLQIFGADGAPVNAVSGVGALPYGWSADGGLFALGSCGGNLVIAAPQAVEVESFTAMTCKAQWSPVESLLAYADQGRLYMWSSAEQFTTHLIELPDLWSWSWSPDGNMLACPDGAGSASVLIDSHDGREHARVPGRASWSASGEWLVGLAPHADQTSSELFTAPGRGGTATSIADGVTSFVWLPDGEHLAYATDREFFTIRVDGNERTRVGTIPGTSTGAGWLLPQAPCRGCAPW